MRAESPSIQHLTDLSSLCLSLIEHAPLPMAMMEGDTHVVRHANPAFCRLLDLEVQHLVGKSLYQLLPAKDKCIGLCEQVFSTGKPINHTEQRFSKPHAIFWAYTMWPVMENEHPMGVMVQVTETARFHEKTLAMNEALLLGALRQHELTEEAERLNAQLRTEVIVRKRGEEALALSEKRVQLQFRELAQIYQYTPVGLFAVDLELCFLRVNEHFAHFSDKSIEEHLGQPVDQVLTASLALNLRQIWQPVLKQGHAILDMELMGPTIRSEMTPRHWLGSFYPLRSSGGEVIGLMGSILDITDRKRAEEQMQLQLTVLQSTADAIVVTDRDAIIQWVNPALTSLTGYTPAEVIGKNPRFFSSGQQDRAFYRKMWRTVLAGKTWRGELINKRKNGSLYPEELTITPVTDIEGAISHFVAIKQDITGRKQLEELLNGRREDLERLVAERTTKLNEIIGELEHFSYAIVHDMRAPLRAMQSYAAMLEQEFANCLPPEGLEYSRRIQRAADRMDHLITDSLQYSKAVGEKLPLGQVDMPILLRDIIDSYPNLIPFRSEITVELGELKVQGNEAALTQCFSNLLGNAIKFAQPDTKPHVRVWAELVGSQTIVCELPITGYAVATGPLQPPIGSAPQAPIRDPQSAIGMVRIWVEDNGVGIAKELQPRVFDLFQRGSNKQEGTGIGLAIVRKTVQRMGGRAGVVSESGIGSRFWVELPVSPTAIGL